MGLPTWTWSLLPDSLANVLHSEILSMEFDSSTSLHPKHTVSFAKLLHYSSDMRPDGDVGQKKFEALSSLDDGVLWEKLHVASSLSCEELCGEVVCDVNVPLDVNGEA